MSNFSKEDLDECRVRIDAIDIRLMELLNERTKIVERIGAIKRSLTLPIYEPKREDQVLMNVLAHNAGPLPADAVRRVFERIMDEMRNLQKTKMVEATDGRRDSAASGQ
jgi:chorismate mutase-like protein